MGRPDGAVLLIPLGRLRSIGELPVAVRDGAKLELLRGEPTVARPAPGVADGGRFKASSRCLAESGGADCDCVTGALPDSEGLVGAEPRELIAGFELLVGLPEFAVLATALPGVRVLAFTVCTGSCDAAGAGVVRATTGRLITEAGGAATCLPTFALPK